MGVDAWTVFFVTVPVAGLLVFAVMMARSPARHARHR
jgi:hypothetical protein